MPLWFVNPRKRRGYKKNPYGKCPKCRVVLTPGGKTCAFCKAKWLNKNPRKGRKMPRKRMKKSTLRRLIATANRKLSGAARKARVKSLRKKFWQNPWVGQGKNRKWEKRSGLDVALRLEARAAREAARKHGKDAFAIGDAMERTRRGVLRRLGVRKAKVTRTKNKAKKARAARKVAKKRKARKGKRMARKKARKGKKSSKRSKAAKKAARTRARKKAKRRAAARKAARSRKRKGGKKMARRRGRKFGKLKYGRHTKKRQGRGARAIRKARHTIRFTKRHGSGAARRVMKYYKMRSNPIAMFKDVAAQVLPLAVAFFGSRIAAEKVGSLPGVGGLLQKIPGGLAPVVVAGGLVYGVHYLTRKVAKLAKYRTAALSGAGLNLLLTALDSFAPKSVKDLIGMSGYQADLSSYEQVGDYEAVDGYEEVGASEELGGIADIPSVSRYAALPSRSVVSPVPAWSAPDDSDLYAGVFSGGGKGWGGY